jgi:hypothetical protein
MRRASKLVLPCVLCLSLCGLCSSCNIIGAVAQVLPRADVAPAYTGLANQTIAVMVWADRGVRIDYPQLQSDVAKDITAKLHEGTRPKDPKQKPSPELSNAQYLDPMAVIRFQADHPELEGLPSTDVATRLGVTRVIYVEVSSFETRSELSIDLFKGTVTGRLEVLEVNKGADGTKTAHVAYADGELSSVYPPHRPEGIAGTDVNAEHIYLKTVDQFATDISLKFVQHPGE